MKELSTEMAREKEEKKQSPYPKKRRRGTYDSHRLARGGDFYDKRGKF